MKKSNVHRFTEKNNFCHWKYCELSAAYLALLATMSLTSMPSQMLGGPNFNANEWYSTAEFFGTSYLVPAAATNVNLITK